MGTFILTPNVVQADNSNFELFLETPIDLDPKLEWEAAIIDGYIPVKSEVEVKTTTKTSDTVHGERYWFRYFSLLGHNGDMQRDDYKSLEKFYYNQYEHFSTIESFIYKFHEVSNKRINYGEFTTQYYLPTILMSIENDYLVLRVIRKMDRYHSAKYEAIVIQLPESQFNSFFGGYSHFDTYYKGVKLKNSTLHPNGNCMFEKEGDQSSIIIRSTGVNMYDTSKFFDPSENDLLGVEFRSQLKIKKHDTTSSQTTSTQVVGEDILFDVECNLIETSKLGNRGDRVMDVMNMNGHENIYPKYLKLEMTKANYISVKIRKSSDKSRVQIEGKPYIVINIRPRI